ncbi:MAG: efflux RND transporter periplasmic adaptor subunit [Verrucomicrobiota bacterium]
MKHLLPILLLPALLAAQGDRRADTVVLDAAGVANLRIQTVVTEPGVFEETIFALGRIEVYPGHRAVVSSRVAGRALEVSLKLDHPVEKGSPAVVVESRQVGDPPPRVTLAAPISGIVSAVDVVTGQPVGPDDSLAEILDLTEVYALARVPEHFAGRLRQGQRAHITIAALSGQTFPAELEHLGAVADPASGTVEAAFHVANPELQLRPGMRAEFSIVVSSHEDVVSVPRAAIQGTPSNRFVYVKDFDLPNAFVKTPVVTGRANDRVVEITRGLLPYDEVVTRGAYSLAFAGGGSLSLKQALDAAHGHEHNPDGSEITSGPKPAGHDDHDHDHDEPHAHPERPWQILGGVLVVALLLVSFRKNRRA